MSLYQADCNGCGLNVHDIPDEMGDRELVLEQFFQRDDAGDLYCRGCVINGQGVFL